jgi:predicted KAP-like P-loop ATPase
LNSTRGNGTGRSSLQGHSFTKSALLSAILIAGIYSIAADMHALRIIHRYLMQENNPSKRGQILKEAMSTTKGLFLPIRRTFLEDRQEKRHKDPSAFLVTEDDLSDLKNICVEKIRVAAKDGTLISHPEMSFILYRWRDWASPEEPKQWVERLIESQDSLLAFLEAFLQRSQSWGLTDYVSRDHWYIRVDNISEPCQRCLVENRSCFEAE